MMGYWDLAIFLAEAALRFRTFVDDEGIPLIDAEYTGSNGNDISTAPVDSDEWAIDGFEDR